MISFGVKTLEHTIELGREAAHYVTTFFAEPISLVFEKCYNPFLLMNKKRYAGLLWTNPLKYDKIDCKGIETVRRDNCHLVRDVVNNVLHKILIERSYEEAIMYCKKIISDLLQNRIDLSLLVITKGLGKKMKSEGSTNQENTY
jgi:DNA polymerase delta subunit 1